MPPQDERYVVDIQKATGKTTTKTTQKEKAK
jgi:hypothetical protein